MQARLCRVPTAVFGRAHGARLWLTATAGTGTGTGTVAVCFRSRRRSRRGIKEEGVRGWIDGPACKAKPKGPKELEPALNL